MLSGDPKSLEVGLVVVFTVSKLAKRSSILDFQLKISATLESCFWLR